MTPEQFCYWLQGRAEMQPDTPPTAAEWRMIGEHLATVFNKVTPALDPNWRHLSPTVAPFRQPITTECKTTIISDGQARAIC